MPELPDVTVYVEALRRRVVGEPLQGVRLANPFVLRSVIPPIDAVSGKVVTEVRRLGKRVVLGLEGDLFLVIHLMIAGRLRWRERDAKPPGKLAHAALDFPKGTLLLTEAGTKKRASIRVVQGEAGLAEQDPGGLEVLDSSLEAFRAALTRESHTLKRSLTDPHLFSGIGNAYSDEILHRAKLSPVKKTRFLSEEEIGRLYAACKETLTEWTERLAAEVGDGFPENVTAFRPEMAVHGKYRQACPVCGAPVQRIVYAENEVNYCPGCQTEGRVLADRALSRLLKEDWPRSLDELAARAR
ncbi:MAG TPA: DNA-formamidopyrimidine glycosylase family protein [Chloroflexota bacterium]|nr:DNA-formamidopyrimidine glycosylase family protein [Chloroflexota bacterium]